MPSVTKEKENAYSYNRQIADESKKEQEVFRMSEALNKGGIRGLFGENNSSLLFFFLLLVILFGGCFFNKGESDDSLLFFFLLLVIFFCNCGSFGLF